MVVVVGLNDIKKAYRAAQFTGTFHPNPNLNLNLNLNPNPNPNPSPNPNPNPTPTPTPNPNQVACGRLSAYFEADLNSWDTAAGVLLVREAGGVVTGLDGARHEVSTRTLLASNADAHAQLQATLEAAGVLGLDPAA